MKKRISAWGPFLVAILLLAGCTPQTGSQDSQADAASAVETEDQQRPVEMTAEMEAKLAAADRLDGAADHVVSKCPTCAFAMEGSDANVTTVGDYSLQFCSSHCRESFSKDLTASLVAMDVPEAEVPADQQP